MSDSDSKKTDDLPAEPRKDWKFTQWFKKMPTQGMQPDADTLSAVSFDKDGKFLATGDRGGRIVVLESDPITGKTKPGGVHFKFHAEFQSHEAEFDYVRTLAVEEKISKIRWLPRSNDSLFILSTNDRAIKLWKIHKRVGEQIMSNNVDIETGKLNISNLSQVRFPTSEQQIDGAGGDGQLVMATLKRNFSADVHAFHINSLCVNTDGETFMSCDNLRINFWNANVPDKAFNVIDTKPSNMQDLTEVITCADFHPQHCYSFCYATSKGTIRLADMREHAILDSYSKVFANATPPTSDINSASPGNQKPDNSFFSDVTLSISDVKFTPNGTGLITRDFMTVKIWDLKMEKKPLEVISVHEYLRPKLWDLYENDCVYDGFEIGVSQEGNICTGSYNNYFHVYDMQRKTDTWAEASKVPIGVYSINPLIWKPDALKLPNGQNNKNKKRPSRTGRSLFSRSKKQPIPIGNNTLNNGKESDDEVNINNKIIGPIPPTVNPDALDYTNKVQHCAWHPKMNAIAVAGANNLFLYSQQLHVESKTPALSNGPSNT
jgi:serine/threonine-protein phosphatase 2A regulatory subunit B